MQKKEDVLLSRKDFIRKLENIKDSYEVNSKPLATGSYGAVHLGVHKITKEKRAVKIIPKYKMASVENFLNEIDLMRLVVFIKSFT